MRARAVDAIAYTIEEDVERAFGCSVDVVALTASISGYGGDTGEGAGARILEVVREPGDQGRGGDEVRVENCVGRAVVVLGPVLVAKDAVSEKCEVDRTQFRRSFREQMGMGIDVIEIDRARGYGSGSARKEVVANRIELACATGNEEEVSLGADKFAADCGGDG